MAQALVNDFFSALSAAGPHTFPHLTRGCSQHAVQAMQALRV